MPRFIVDESTGAAVVRFLRDQGYDVVSVGEEMPQATDDAILARAWSEKRVVVTNDKDFGDKAFRDRQPHAGILLLRLSDDRTATKLRVIAAVLERYADKLENSFAVATEHHIRLREPKP